MFNFNRLLFSLALLAALYGAEARAAVAIDALGTDAFSATAVTSLTFTGITVGAGANRALVVSLNFTSNVTTVSPTGITCTWDSGGTNQAMTAIAGATAVRTGGSRFMMVYMLGLVAPTAGNKTLSCSWTNAAFYVVNAISFTGASQLGGNVTFAHGNGANGASTTAAVTITSAVGDFTLATESVQGVIASMNQTAWYLDNNPPQSGSAGTTATGAASVAYSSTVGNGQWAIAGTDICAVGCAAGAGRNLLLLGVGQ